MKSLMFSLSALLLLTSGPVLAEPTADAQSMDGDLAIERPNQPPSPQPEAHIQAPDPAATSSAVPAPMPATAPTSSPTSTPAPAPMPTQASALVSPEEALAQLLKRLGTGPFRLSTTETIFQPALLKRLYKANHNRLLWDGASTQALNLALEGLAADGLDPDSYRIGRLKLVLPQPRQVIAATEAEQGQQSPVEPPQADSQPQTSDATTTLQTHPDPDPGESGVDAAPTVDETETTNGEAGQGLAQSGGMSGQDAAILDLLKTEAFLRALYNLKYGKVDPERLDADFNYAQVRTKTEPDQEWLDWIKGGQIEAAFEAMRPKHQAYLGLKEALKRFRDLAATGGWPSIPAGRSLKVGMKDARIPLIRQRLAVDIAPDIPLESEDYDEPMLEAVKAFQQNYGIEGDGIIGPATTKAMSQSARSRVDQIRVNLERERWFNPDSIPEYLAIDVAGYRLRWWRDGAMLWDERVQVGKARSPTPIFRDELEHLVFNPDWSVPPSINRRTILPSLKLDPDYLGKKGYLLLDEQGNEINPLSVDWESLERMPYIVRQPPGPNNALGRVKFMFPNKHHVFLHDTNHPEFFRKDVRTTSSGCVRLRDPFELAQRLLAPQEDWNRGHIDNLIASHVTTQVNLKRRLPIVIFYSTVAALPDGLSFRDDIYSRDSDVLHALNAPFSLHLPELPKGEQERIRKTLASASTPLNIAAEPEVIGTPQPNKAPDKKKKQKNAWDVPGIFGF